MHLLQVGITPNKAPVEEVNHLKHQAMAAETGANLLKCLRETAVKADNLHKHLADRAADNPAAADGTDSQHTALCNLRSKKSPPLMVVP